MTTPVWPVYRQDNTVMKKANGPNTLGKDDFLKILVTQLKNQDPMQPLQDREFIAQMAQFSSVEQIMNMGKELSMLRQSFGFSAGLIGMEVSWNELNTQSGQNELKQGIVDGIIVKDGVQHVIVGQTSIPVDSLLGVRNQEETPDE